MHLKILSKRFLKRLKLWLLPMYIPAVDILGSGGVRCSSQNVHIKEELIREKSLL